MIGCYFTVSFEFFDDRPDANSQDFRDELTANPMFQQAYLENRMTNVEVRINHAKNLERAFEEAPDGQV